MKKNLGFSNEERRIFERLADEKKHGEDNLWSRRTKERYQELLRKKIDAQIKHKSVNSLEKILHKI